MNDVYEEVQAALLNSEGDPREQVYNALRATLGFAQSELDLGPSELRSMCAEVVQELGA